jgi:hypothetical protein
MAFSVLVEMLNLRASRRTPPAPAAPHSAPAPAHPDQ